MQTILEPFEYFCQISSKLILILSGYTVSKLGRFFETQCPLFFHLCWLIALWVCVFDIAVLLQRVSLLLMLIVVDSQVCGQCQWQSWYFQHNNTTGLGLWCVSYSLRCSVLRHFILVDLFDTTTALSTLFSVSVCLVGSLYCCVCLCISLYWCVLVCLYVCVRTVCVRVT